MLTQVDLPVRLFFCYHTSDCFHKICEDEFDHSTSTPAEIAEK